MEYTTLGRSGLHVSRACLGAMMFADAKTGLCNEQDSRRIIDHFIEAGGNFIDTADVYSWHESEAIVGRAIAETGASGPRDMGQVMKAVMAASGGRADGKRASAAVREALSA